MAKATDSNTPIPTTRRALLAAAPAAAAAALVGGTAVNPVAVAMAGDGDGELLALAAEFDPLFELWRKMSIEQRADQLSFDEVLHKKTGMTREEARELECGSPEWQAYSVALRSCHKESPPLYDEETWEPVRDRFYEVAEEILSYDATTREGFVLQVRAFTSSYSEIWEDECDSGAAEFVGCACAFAGVPFPLYNDDDVAALIGRGHA
jgi:hypothetical protein